MGLRQCFLSIQLGSGFYPREPRSLLGVRSLPPTCHRDSLGVTPREVELQPSRLEVRELVLVRGDRKERQQLVQTFLSGRRCADLRGPP